MVEHHIYRTSSVDWVIENLPTQMKKADVVNLLITNDQDLKNVDLSSIILDEQEQLRVNRLIKKEDAFSFILRRKMLKKLLNQFKGITNLALSFSHSNKNNSLFYSFSSNGQVGADIEQISPYVDFMSIARLFFSEPEKARLQSQKQSNKEDFFQMWTRKEALAKCAQISLQTVLKLNLFSSEKTLSSISIRGCDYSIYSYQRNQIFISVATSKNLKTITTYELGKL